VVYSVNIPKDVHKELRNFPKVVRARLLARAMALSNDARPSGVKKLRGYDSTYRVRVGNYRIIYEVDDHTQQISVVRIADRKDAYH
jgi:mRNA interferase RelE/StbE